ncbi:hypothetical protein EBE87_05110 [Pseudoroseomonas wenyumeiae]|uniref:Tryptophan-rich sensory protein n=1 Tax=Teichococcus wenyumeiae TaxID=2478470 RepID=A0A3A9JEW5_9PROT|nr:hypothetical protein [Pseudoroseomonas wenyumeiae]RKK03233.1 hypothetical protein D6Z83_15665 [Pseudoroseomonas wenyumeiae]RMI26645.1 hypothetical protein EBE87_05110 [Pseudoroseomonas wenyumeiae]
MTSNNLRTILNLVLPILQPVIGALAPVFGIGMTMQEMSAGSETPITPSGYAFSIWGVIFTLAIAWGIWQALPAGRDSVAARRLGWPLAGAFACSNLWMLLSQLTGNGWHLVVVILALLACVLAAFFIARAEPGQGWVDTWIIYPLTGLFAGWVSAATFVNIASAAVLSGVIRNEGMTGSLAAILILLAAAGVALGVLWTAHGAPWYAAAFAWALLGIIAANTVDRDLNLLVAAVAAVLLVLVAALSWQRSRMRRHRLPV